MKDKGLTRFENGSALWNGDHPGNHDFREPVVERRRQQTTGGHDTGQTLVVIYRVKIDNLLAYASVSNRCQRLLHRQILAQGGDILSRHTGNWLVQVGWVVNHDSFALGALCAPIASTRPWA